jgi:ribosomal protein S18 acetylase RimI-like enzyme
MFMNILVRPARSGDEESIQANCKTSATIEQVRAQVRCTTAEQGLRRLAHFVADREGEVIGTVMLEPAGAHLVPGQAGLTFCPGPHGHPMVGVLVDLVVASQFWRQGIGTALTEQVVAEARRWGLIRLETSSLNPAAIAMFRSRGFRQHGSLPLLPGAPAQWHGGTAEALFHMDLV